MNGNSLLSDVIGLSCSEQNISWALRRSLCLPDSLLAKLHTFKYLHQSFIMFLYKLSFIRETFYVMWWKENCQQSMTLQWGLSCDACSPWRRPTSPREKKVYKLSLSSALTSLSFVLFSKTGVFQSKWTIILKKAYTSIIVTYQFQIKTNNLFYIYTGLVKKSLFMSYNYIT